MKILNWNIRGAGRKGFVQQVHELVRYYNPDILFFGNEYMTSVILKKLIFVLY